MADNKVMARWEAGSPAITAWMTTHSLLVAQSLSSSGVDAVVVDMQHGSATLDDMLALIACIEVRGAEPFVRVPSIDAGLIGRLLDAGATGIIAPLVESVDQAQAFLEAAFYPPAGNRSYGPRIPSLRWGASYASNANRQIIALAMVETALGMSALNEILSVKGLSGIFVGPSDLSFSLGFPPPQSAQPEEVAVAIDRIRSSVANSNGKRSGIFCPNVAAAEAALASGFDLVTSPPDLALVEAGTRSAVDRLRNPPSAPRRLN